MNDGQVETMAVDSGRRGDDSPPALPAVVPLDLPYLSRLSWELGSRVVDDDEAALFGEWERGSGRWALSVFDVTSETVVIRTRTPVGREQFYGTTRAELEAALPELDAAPAWTRRAGGRD